MRSEMRTHDLWMILNPTSRTDKSSLQLQTPIRPLLTISILTNFKNEMWLLDYIRVMTVELSHTTDFLEYFTYLSLLHFQIKQTATTMVTFDKQTSARAISEKRIK